MKKEEVRSKGKIYYLLIFFIKRKNTLNLSLTTFAEGDVGPPLSDSEMEEFPVNLLLISSS